MTPEPGDVISYAYLWQREAETGQEEGLKDRPSVVVVAQQISAGKVTLFVAPVTHSKPDRTTDAIEIPSVVKANLGLDRERSWVITTELNRFVWPGPDVRIVRGSDDASPLYGAIPAVLFEDIKAQVLANTDKRGFGMVKRTQ